MHKLLKFPLSTCLSSQTKKCRHNWWCTKVSQGFKLYNTTLWWFCVTKLLWCKNCSPVIICWCSNSVNLAQLKDKRKFHKIIIFSNKTKFWLNDFDNKHNLVLRYPEYDYLVWILCRWFRWTLLFRLMMLETIFVNET